MLPRSPVRERCARAAPPQLKFEDRKCLGAVLRQTVPRHFYEYFMSIFEASRLNALALPFRNKRWSRAARSPS